MSSGSQMPVPDWAEEIMKQDFPDFFKGKPIKIKALPQYMRRVQLVSSADHNSMPRIRFEAPKPSSRKAAGTLLDPELQEYIHIQYSATPPIANRNGMPVFAFKSSRIEVGDGFIIRPGQKDLLFYVHFLCPNILSNKCQSKVARPYFDYDRPQIDASTKINEAKRARELENLIYFDTPYDVILSTMSGLGMKAMDTEEQNRVALHDSIKRGSDTFRKNAFELIGSQPKKTVEKNTVQNEKAPESIHEMVNRLLNDNFIKNDEGLWYIRDRRGDGTKWLKTPFFESSKHNEEAVFALIDHLSSNEVLLRKLRDL